jgi:hypothetical protein
MPDNDSNWLRLDERTNALDNLDMALFFLRTLPEPMRWKWVILASHQALYGFAVAAVQGTDALSVLKIPDNPNSDLISVWEALRRVQDVRYLWPGSTPLSMTLEESAAVKRVGKEFRNGFEHFAPASWSIEVTGMPLILSRFMRVVHGIAIGTQSIQFSESEGDRVRTTIAAIGTELRLT